MLEDAAVLEGHAADLQDVLALFLLEDLVVYSQGLQQYDHLPIEESGLVLIPIQDIQVFLGRVVGTNVFNHALPEHDGVVVQEFVEHQEALCPFVPDLDYA